MFRRTFPSHDFSYFGKTRVGQELALRTKLYMNDLNQGSRGNFMTRFLSRKRGIDRMQVEVDDHIAQELHWSFGYLMKAWTTLMISPVIAGLFLGKIAPTRLMVTMNITTQERYDAIWEHANIAWVLVGQAGLALLYYDLSVYLRYPVFKHVFAPIYRKLGLFRPHAVGTMGLKDLKSGAAKRKLQENLRGNAANTAPSAVAGAAGKKQPLSSAAFGANASASFKKPAGGGGGNSFASKISNNNKK